MMCSMVLLDLVFVGGEVSPTSAYKDARTLWIAFLSMQQFTLFLHSRSILSLNESCCVPAATPTQNVIELLRERRRNIEKDHGSTINGWYCCDGISSAHCLV
jgi:hypothetical protein